MKRLHLYFLAALLVSVFSYAQPGFRFLEGQDSEKLRFKFINNLIIIPVEVNGVALSFVLDTGVNKPILFNLVESDSVKIKNVEEILIRGLGEGDAIKAYRSRGNRFRLGNNVYNNSQDLYVILDENINFSHRLGFPVHGIVGYDLIKDFVVEINYSRNILKLRDPKKYQYKNCKKCESFPLDFILNKPYIDVVVDMET